ncbi:MAG: lysine-sensitive aspartokinase 3 [bacterium]
MIIMKFGGTSVGSAPCIQQVSAIIEKSRKQNPVIVVSAVSGITDKLESLCKKITQISKDHFMNIINEIALQHINLSDKLDCTDSNNFIDFIERWKKDMNTLSQKLKNNNEKILHDLILSQGEWLSIHLLTAYLKSIGLPAVPVDAKKIIKTDSQFTKANPNMGKSKCTARKFVQPFIDTRQIPVIQGFTGSDPHNRVTTLGRGGSDLSATILGCLLQAERVEIWSDVDGVLTTDPTIIPYARRIRCMSFNEASELSYFGAKVLHPSTLLPAIEHNIPVKVLNTMRPEDSGTVITKKITLDSNKKCIIKSIAYKENLTIITITSTRMLMAYGFLAKIFAIFEKYKTSVDLVTTSEVSVSLTIDNAEYLDDIIPELKKYSEVEVKSKMAIVCLVGEQMKNEPRHVGKIFNSLQDIHIHMISQGASEINISFVIAQIDINKTITRLHKEFFEDDKYNKLFIKAKPKNPIQKIMEKNNDE